MEILAHRGFWKHREERNTKAAFERALDCGFGIETDIRDLDGCLVVSHDPPRKGALELDELLSLYNHYRSGCTLALNIKSDGLYEQLRTAIYNHSIESYFVFDMSIPDSVAYIAAGLRVYLRRSEYEPLSSLEDKAAGIWFDSFNESYPTCTEVAAWLDGGGYAALVSPELHSRPREPAWSSWLAGNLSGSGKVLLCTDFPEEASNFFKM